MSTKEIMMRCNLEKLEKLKKEIFNKVQQVFLGSIKFDIFDKIKEYRTCPNCIDCKNFNFGRIYWICLKKHNIHQEYDNRDLIQFGKTHALEECEDYEERDRYKFDKAKVIGIKKSIKKRMKDYVKKRRKKM